MKTRQYCTLGKPLTSELWLAVAVWSTCSANARLSSERNGTKRSPSDTEPLRWFGFREGVISRVRIRSREADDENFLGGVRVSARGDLLSKH